MASCRPTVPATSVLHEALQDARPFVLRPRAFFASWSGVITLAFSGWPPQAVAVKAKLDKRLGTALRPENFGSRWPKITLGALREGREPLNFEELKVLTDICKDVSQQEFIEGSWHMSVQSLAQTLMVWPSHEWLISRFEVPLEGGAVDESKPDEEALGYVDSVLLEGEDLEAYLPAVQRPGDISKYRSAAVGASLVAFMLPIGAGADAVPASLAKLRSRVDEALPGTYDWMQAEALHCTLRALV